MDGLLGFQTSGNDWSTTSPPMLHQRAQERCAPRRPAAQSLILENFEVQRAQAEREFAVQLEDLGKVYVIPTDGSTAKFLNDHRALPQILIAALPYLRKYFPKAVLALRATSDEFGWENLYVDVLWPGDALDAFRILGRFGDEWWIANSRPARGALTFTYRLV